MDPILIGAVVVVLIIVLQQLAKHLGEQDRIPLDRAFKEHGVLVGSEVRLSFRSDISVAGRVDQLWTVPNAGYLLVDTKNRSRAAVYESDRLQLSIYAWLLRRSERYGDKAVIETGFVRIPVGNGPAKFLPVKLMSDQETEAIIYNAFSLASHRQASNPPRCYRCGHCGHISDCQPRR